MWLTHLEFDATNPFMISARVRTVTMTVWARAALDDHRGGETMGEPSDGPILGALGMNGSVRLTG